MIWSGFHIVAFKNVSPVWDNEVATLRQEDGLDGVLRFFLHYYD